MLDYLNADLVVTHPFVLGELALGSLPNRAPFLKDLDRLAQIAVARNEEVRQLIESRKLYSKGIGWVDAHLIASILIHPPTQLWTTDKRLVRAAAEIGLPSHLGSLPN